MFIFHILNKLIYRCKDTILFLNFLSWRIFISSVGAFLLPQLAHFCFLSWRFFVSSVGGMQLGCEIFSMENGKAVINFDHDVIHKIWDNYYVPFVLSMPSQTDCPVP